MDCIREAENYLRYYRELQQSLKHSKRMIAKLTWQTAPREVGATANDVTGVRAEKVANTLNQLYQLQMWQEMKDRTEEAIAEVDETLDVICTDPDCERYKEMLQMWYVDKKDKDEIADAFGYSSRQSVYDLKGKAIKKFAISLYGITALKAV